MELPYMQIEQRAVLAVRGSSLRTLICDVRSGKRRCVYQWQPPPDPRAKPSASAKERAARALAREKRARSLRAMLTPLLGHYISSFVADTDVDAAAGNRTAARR